MNGMAHGTHGTHGIRNRRERLITEENLAQKTRFPTIVPRKTRNKCLSQGRWHNVPSLKGDLICSNWGVAPLKQKNFGAPRLAGKHVVGDQTIHETGAHRVEAAQDEFSVTEGERMDRRRNEGARADWGRDRRAVRCAAAEPASENRRGVDGLRPREPRRVFRHSVVRAKRCECAGDGRRR